MINETAARMFWPHDDPIGKHIEIGQGGMDNAEVVGIVGGVRQRADSAPRPEVYVAFAQTPRSGMIVFVHSQRDPGALGPDLRRAIHEVAPTLPIYDVRTMSDRAAAATAQARFRAVLLTVFAITALALAAVGIYGVMSLAVTARTREMGIRIALGAERARVQRLVIGEGIGLVAVGAVVGLAGALAATRVLRTFLFDLTSSDPAHLCRDRRRARRRGDPGELDSGAESVAGGPGGGAASGVKLTAASTSEPRRLSAPVGPTGEALPDARRAGVRRERRVT